MLLFSVFRDGNRAMAAWQICSMSELFNDFSYSMYSHIRPIKNRSAAFDNVLFLDSSSNIGEQLCSRKKLSSPYREKIIAITRTEYFDKRSRCT